MTKRRVLILGAAGRDFHNFNVVYRDDPGTEVVGFTATQIPKIDGRVYPASLAGPHYPRGIRIYEEDALEALVREQRVDECVFAYSDVSYMQVGHAASRALAAGADFRLVSPRETMLPARKPVVAITAIRTGCGKSPTTRYIARALRADGKRVVVVRHPMPYGDLGEQAVQRFGTLEDLDTHKCTFEEREEYESHIAEGSVVYAGVDYGAILERATDEADVILWDGGNNDWPFYKPDVWLTITDPLRAGHEVTYYPGEVNLRSGDVVIINKVNTASAEDLERLEAEISLANPDATLLRTKSVVSVEGAVSIKGKRVLCIEDGPTLTHGGMTYGAGRVAALAAGATIVDPRPNAVGSIRQTLQNYPHIGELLPAMGYYPDQIRDMEASVRATDCDVVLVGTPFDLSRQLKIDKPAVRVRYETEDAGEPTLADVVLGRLHAREPAGAH